MIGHDLIDGSDPGDGHWMFGVSIALSTLVIEFVSLDKMISAPVAMHRLHRSPLPDLFQHERKDL
jgi:hypothetical protein